MGNLVFQATLGGQVNLVGPNTASTYNINVPAVAGTMVTTGDTGSVSSTMLASSLSLTTPNINVATGTSLKVTSGFYSTSSSSFTYTDGIVMDYTTGLGRISVGTSDGLAFYNAGVATTELMRLDSSGNLGIGTSSPAAKLNVSGQTRVTDSSNSANYMTFGVGANASYGNASISTTTAGLAIVAEGAGNMTFLNNGSERMRIDSSGNLLVGQTARGLRNSNSFDFDISDASAYMNHVSGSSSGSTYIYFGYNAGAIGSISQSGTTAVAYNTSSDYRLKHDIYPMTGALAKVAALKPCTYKWNADNSDGEGFIAHELAQVCPHAVTGEKDAVDADGNPVYQGIDTSFLVATLTAAIQEQQAIIQQLQADVAALKG